MSDFRFVVCQCVHSLIDVRKGNVIKPSLVQDICSSSRRRSLKHLQVHFENAPRHNSRQSNDCLHGTKTRRMAQPADSPDLGPSDFFLFGLLKQYIQGVHFLDRETLKSPICRIFNEIDREVFIPVFLD
jgi:hypothetical protein